MSVEDPVKNKAVKQPMAGFTVNDAGAVGFDVEIRVIWNKNKPPEADAIQSALTSVYAKAFAEVGNRLEE